MVSSVEPSAGLFNDDGHIGWADLGNTATDRKCRAVQDDRTLLQTAKKFFVIGKHLEDPVFSGQNKTLPFPLKNNAVQSRYQDIKGGFRGQGSLL